MVLQVSAKKVELPDPVIPQLVEIESKKTTKLEQVPFKETKLKYRIEDAPVRPLEKKVTEDEKDPEKPFDYVREKSYIKEPKKCSECKKCEKSCKK